MLYAETTCHISTETLTLLLSRRIQGHVRIQRENTFCLFHCQPTPEFHQLVSVIQQHGGLPVLVEGHVLVLKLYIPSKI
jgi:hypothetical protein